MKWPVRGLALMVLLGGGCLTARAQTSEPSAEPAISPVTLPTTEPTTTASEAATNPSTEPAADATNPATTEASTIPTSLPSTENMADSESPVIPATFPSSEPTTQSTTMPTTEPSTNPTTSPATQAATTMPVVAPTALSGTAEGTFFPERTGRLRRSQDGRQIEFVFDQDGKSVEVPILQNLELMRLENAIGEDGWDLQFRVSGWVTEYKGKNYILLDHAERVEESPKDWNAESKSANP